MFLNKVIDSRGVDYIVGLFEGSLRVLAKQWKDVFVIYRVLFLTVPPDCQHQNEKQFAANQDYFFKKFSM